MTPAIAQLFPANPLHRNRPALIDASCALPALTLTHDEVHQHAARLAGALAGRGLVPGSRVVAILPNGLDLALLYLACLHGGFTAVPIGIDQPAETVAGLVAAVDPAMVIAAPGVTAPDAVPLWRLDGPRSLVGLDAALAPACPDPGQPLMIAFTSGTTSRPKGVCHAAGGMVANVRAFNRLAGLDAETRMLHVMPMTYMAGMLNTLLSPLAAGGCAILAPAFDVSTALRFWEPARTHGANTAWLSPTMAALLVRVHRDPQVAAWTAANLRRVFAGTAPLPEKVAEDFHACFGVRLLESYGMTEILLASVCLAPRHGVVGKLLEGVEMQTRTDEGAPLPAGTEGDLWVRSSYAMLGYLDAAGQVCPQGTESWFATGDIGLVDGDGILAISGRRKDLIIHGGVNVSPRAIEEVLLACPGVADAAVIGMPHPFWGEEVVACLQLAEGTALAEVEATAKAQCKARLPAAAQPARFAAFDRFPRNTTGKVQKHLLRASIA